MILAARFSDDIHADVARNWSAWMHPNLGGTIEECQEDAELLGLDNIDIREFPDGGFALVHHNGLSCYVLESTDVDSAIEEVKASTHSGDGYGEASIGKVKVLKSVKIEGYRRTLHILEIENYESEGAF